MKDLRLFPNKAENNEIMHGSDWEKQFGAGGKSPEQVDAKRRHLLRAATSGSVIPRQSCKVWRTNEHGVQLSKLVPHVRRGLVLQYGYTIDDKEGK